MGFNESKEYKKTFIDSGVGTGSVQVLQGVEFVVEPHEDHIFEVKPHGNVDHVVGSQGVQTPDLIYYHSARDREQHSVWELFSYREDSNEAAFAVAAVVKIYPHKSLTFNDTVAYEIISKWKTGLKKEMDARLDVKWNVLGMEIVRDQSGNTLRVSQSRFYNGKFVQTLLKGHSILSLKGSLSGDYDVEKNGLPTEIYALVSQHRVAKDLWEKIKLLMQGTSLTKQERECKLYDEFDKFTYKKGESLHEYYFEIPSMILNDMNIYKMPLEQFQINTKFLNTLLKNGAIVYYGDKLLATVLSGDYTPGASGSNSGKQRTVICYNCKGEVSLHGEFISLMNRAELLAEKEPAVLRDLVDHIKANYPLDTLLESACKYTKLIQEMLSKIRVKQSTSVSGSHPSGNTKKDKIQQTPSSTLKNKVESHPRKVVQIVLWYLDSGCSKHMTEDRSQLTNFVSKFLGTVKFGNDHVAKIMAYGDYQIGNVTISRVYYVERLGYNLFSVGQFCNSNLKVAFCQHTCYIRNLEGVDLLTGSRGDNLYTLSLGDMIAVPLLSGSVLKT
ncbi:hypothetical protein Tco_0214943 [Tanacetum coccineum]